MPSGCLRRRIASASCPRTGVGAWRYSSSASALFTRSPVRTFSTSSVMLCMIKARRAVVGRETYLRGVAIERLESFELLPPKKVPDIIAQVATSHGLAAWVVGTVRCRDLVDVRQALITRVLQGRGVLRHHRVRPPRPERVHEWK